MQRGSSRAHRLLPTPPCAHTWLPTGSTAAAGTVARSRAAPLSRLCWLKSLAGILKQNCNAEGPCGAPAAAEAARSAPQWPPRTAARAAMWELCRPAAAAALPEPEAHALAGRPACGSPGGLSGGPGNPNPSGAGGRRRAGAPAGAGQRASPPRRRTLQTAAAARRSRSRTGDTVLLRAPGRRHGRARLGAGASAGQGAPVVGRKYQGSRRSSGS